MTHGQKLAWAKRHGVTPPKHVEVAAAAEAKSTKACCASKKKAACCSIATLTKPEQDGVAWSLALQRAKCQGAATEWLSLGACVPLQIEEMVVTLPEVACVSMKKEWSVSPVYCPASPPPRQA